MMPRHAAKLTALMCLGAATTSCAFGLTQAPPRDHERRTYFVCNESYRTPMGDAVTGLIFLPTVFGAIPWLASAWVGFNRVSACNRAKADTRTAFLSYMAEPTGLRADASISSVVVSPSGSDTVRVGASSALRAAALTVTGAEIAGRQFLWSSSDSAVATVDSQGRVLGRAAGSARVTATTGGISGSLNVFVLP